MAREKDLDLVEISPNANPPVAKIISWSKFKYELSKKKKESKGKSIEQKEMWFSATIEKGDLDHKLGRIKEFLSKKHPVKITIKTRGRTPRERILEVMNRIIEELKDSIQYDNNAKFEGRNYIAIVRPIK